MVSRTALWFPTLLGWVSPAAGMVLAITDYQLQTLGAVRRAAYAKDNSCQAVWIQPSYFWEERGLPHWGELGTAIWPHCQTPAPGLSNFTSADKLVGGHKVIEGRLPPWQTRLCKAVLFRWLGAGCL